MAFAESLPTIISGIQKRVVHSRGRWRRLLELFLLSLSPSQPKSHDLVPVLSKGLSPWEAREGRIGI